MTQINKIVLAMVRLALNLNDTNSFLTGSRVYAVPTEKSDFDVCVNLSEKGRILNLIEELQISAEPSRFYDNIKFDLNGELINIIFLEEVNYSAWKNATSAYLALNAEGVNEYISDAIFSGAKAARYKVFQSFVVAFGGELPEVAYGRLEDASFNI